MASDNDNTVRKNKERNRRPVRQLQAARAVRDYIVERRFLPGDRLPTRRELVQELEISPATVQLAMSRLEHEGFIESRGSAGTFVSEYLPHMSRFALLFPSHPTSPVEKQPWSNFFTSLVAAAAELSQQRPDLAIETFFNIYFKGRNYYKGTNKDYNALCHDVRQHKLAGLIFPVPHALIDRRLKDVPSVLIAHPDVDFPNVATLPLDYGSFYRLGIQRLAERGCRRAGLLTVFTADNWHLTWRAKCFRQACAAAGMETKPHLCQFTLVGHSAATWSATAVLTHLPDGERPDGLLIDDDHLVPVATQALAQSGAPAGNDIRVVAHANFPHPPVAAVPVDYLGFDSTRLLETAVEMIRDIRRGRAAHEGRLVSVVFEDDLRKVSDEKGLRK